MRQGSRGTGRAWSALDVLVLLLMLGVGGTLLAPVLLQPRCGKTRPRTRCANHLRQLSLAAIAYADDRRFYPSLATRARLAGGPESDHAPRVVETLAHLGYLDDPEAPVCPASQDTPRRLPGPLAARAGAPVPLFDPAPYPTLDQATHLSYGWTRRRLNLNAPSSSPLAADRAVRRPRRPGAGALPPGQVGNHEDGLNVARVDGSTAWVDDPTLAAPLVATDPARPESGFLGIHLPDAPR